MAKRKPRVSGHTPFVSFVVYCCFFVSGFTALIYELAWLNRIQLVMGHTVYALATTLSAYLVGLALGALAVKRVLRSRLSSLWLYFLAELFVGLWGFAFYGLLRAVELPYNLLVRMLTPGVQVLSLVQFFFCGLLVVVPTILMGMTLPLLADYLFEKRNELSAKISSLYATNTLGACVGVFTAGYLILPGLGYFSSILLAASLNLSIYGTARLLFHGRHRSPTLGEIAAGLKRIVSRDSSVEPPAPLGVADIGPLTVLFVSGIAAMLVQIGWNRLTALAYGATTYVFPLVTSIVLLGIVIGSLLVRLVSRQSKWLQILLLLAPAASGVVFAVSTYSFTFAPLHVLGWHLNEELTFESFVSKQLGFGLSRLLLASICLGSLFPLATTVLTHDKNGGATRALSIGYAVNIGGLIIGALLGSFVLMPHWGFEAMHRFLTSLLILSSLFLACLSFRTRWPVAVGIGAVFLLTSFSFPAYDRTLLTSGYFYNRVRKSFRSLMETGGVEAVNDVFRKAHVLLEYQDDPHATISIHENPATGNVFFRVTGKTDGDITYDLGTTQIVGVLHALTRTSIKKALTIGLGVGSSVNETLDIPGLESTTLVEISPAMLTFAKKHFGAVSGRIWTDKRLIVENRDGREFLRNTKETYDLIISEPSNPWMDGIASLFTREFYELVNARLSHDGIAALWFHTYGLECTTIGSVFRAAASVFRNMLVFYLNGDIFMLVNNADEPIMLHQSESSGMEEKIFRSARIPDTLPRDERYRLLVQRMLVMDKQMAEEFADGSPINTDDNQILQYASGRTFWHRQGCSQVFMNQRGFALVEQYYAP